MIIHLGPKILSLKYRPLGLALLCIIQLLYLGNTLACGMAWREHDAPAQMASERSLIIWDAQKQRQHFIRSSQFETSGSDLGFIVPVPSIPEVADISEDVFKALDDEMERQRPRQYVFFENPNLRDGMIGGGMPGALGRSKGINSVNIVATYQLADYEVKVIEASSLEPLANWLHENEFHMRPALSKWLESYLLNSHFFTVFKFRRNSISSEFKSKAVRVSFDTPKPYYPYRDAEDMFLTSTRSLLLYFLSDARYDPDFYGQNDGLEAPQNWRKMPLFSNFIRVPATITPFISEKMNWLTTWQDHTARRPDRDLSFGRSTKASEPILLSVKTVEYGSYVIATSMLFSLLLISFFGYKLSKIIIHRKSRKR